MDAHRVDILHVADGDAVVGGVSHHLVLDLLPADQGAFEENLIDGACGESACDEGIELVKRGSDAATRASKRVCRAYDQGQI